MFLELLVGMLSIRGGLQIVGQARTVAEGLAACSQHAPELLFLDLSLPDGDGLAVARQLIEVNPRARVIIVTGQASSFVCPTWLDCHLQAVISKNDTFQSLRSELDDLLVPARSADANKPPTRREAEVFAMVGEGLSSQQIADRLGLSVHTVLTHRKRLAAKLGTRGMELTSRAIAQRVSLFPSADDRPCVLHPDRDANAVAAAGSDEMKSTFGAVRMAGISQDVMERTHGENQLQKYREQLLVESEHRFRSFFELPIVGTAITSRAKGWMDVNDETCRILGYPREELFQKTWTDLTHPDDLAADNHQFERMLRREIDGYTLEKRFIHKDGRVIHVILSGGCGAIGNAAPEVFYVTLLDISERRAIETELAAAREREKKTTQDMRLTLEKKLKTSLNAAAVAHEINQPLSRVLLRAQMSLETATGAERDMLAALVADAERVVSTIEKMKVLLRNVETVQHEVDLADITASAMHQVKRPLREAGVTVTRKGRKRGCLLLGDEVQLQMIVTNLLTNAIEAIGSGEAARREIVIEQIARENVVELVVGDSGPGWQGGTLDEILLNTTKPGGAGIGLYVVKTAVDNHGGQMTIGRSPLGGAEFRITFPRSVMQKKDRGGFAGKPREPNGRPTTDSSRIAAGSRATISRR